MTEFLERLLSSHNEFASGGLLLMIIGGLGVYLRAVPRRLWEWFVCQTTLMITVKNDDAAFAWVKEWLVAQNFMKRIRRVDLDTTLRSDTLALIPAPGRHWFWHAGRPFAVELHRSEDTRGWSPRLSEWLTLRTVGRSQTFLRRFVDEVAECHRTHVGRNSLLYLYDERWTSVVGYVPRVFDSVILREGEKEHLVQDIQKFKSSRERYRKLGVPYHRGYLFYGPPGTGKSSLASALAQKFWMSIYMINLNRFNDRTLAAAINDIPPSSVILFEDIDCMGTGDARAGDDERSGIRQLANRQDDEARPESPGVTLSGLLNVLDGFVAPDDVLFVMTSNEIDALDPALLRPGRIDYRLFMGEATEQQKLALYKRFFPAASESEARSFVALHDAARTMAEFQGILLAMEWDQQAEGSLARHGEGNAGVWQDAESEFAALER
jgi:chaperone BCS1